MNPYANWYMWRLQYIGNIQANYNADDTVLLLASGGNYVGSGTGIGLLPRVNSVLVPRSSICSRKSFRHLLKGCTVFPDQGVIALLISNSPSECSLDFCEPEPSGPFRIVGSSSRRPIFSRLIMIE